MRYFEKWSLCRGCRKNSSCIVISPILTLGWLPSLTIRDETLLILTVALKFCGEEELVRQVHTLFVRTAQQVVVYELQVQEEVEGVRQEVREVEGESKARMDAHMNMNMWMG